MTNSYDLLGVSKQALEQGASDSNRCYLDWHVIFISEVEEVLADEGMINSWKDANDRAEIIYEKIVTGTDIAKESSDYLLRRLYGEMKIGWRLFRDQMKLFDRKNVAFQHSRLIEEIEKVNVRVRGVVVEMPYSLQQALLEEGIIDRESYSSVLRYSLRKEPVALHITAQPPTTKLPRITGQPKRFMTENEWLVSRDTER